ncbi:HNH endonuclease [Xanthobacter lutulentifluminis]|uniref:HNH endonuclease n=1 Tax=Xanthobacter lutulentifluminis TaxID=3119935 RepID=UPI0037360766
MNNIPPQELLREWLVYDPDIGVFRWRKEPRACRPLLGEEAGTRRSSGYIFIKARGYPQIGAHRLAWVYMFGGIPTGLEVDHIDGDPSNNRISNLRLATSTQQKMNKRVQANNRSGLKGAFYHECRRGKKWRSQIKANGRVVFLGYFHTAEEAHAKYAMACREYFGEFGRSA